MFKRRKKNVKLWPIGKKRDRKFRKCQTKKPSQLGFFGWKLEAEVWGKKLPTMSPPILQPFLDHQKMLTGNSNTEGDWKVHNNLFEQNASFIKIDGFLFRFLFYHHLWKWGWNYESFSNIKYESWLIYVSFLQKLFSKNPQKGCSFFCWSLDFQLLLGF